MEASSTSNVIMVAGKRILCAQTVLGLLFIGFEYFRYGTLSAESAFTGVVIAVVPSLIGMLLASIKSKFKPTESLRDLMNLSRNIKVIYTILMFVLTFRFMALRNIVVLIAFSVTMLGHFFTPMFKDKAERKA
ncbi:ATP synthase subunit I [Vibrio fluvialis]|uniref:ATP synthase subunit I n=1 Tax=Vibrio fluvialis TaxID=676 RepID=UPI001F301FBB|nr:ATP synthase subunit I [Vibrio fluvialis]MCE7600984.1 ATP synthase subunit I [Vibrio fluvialis]